MNRVGHDQSWDQLKNKFKQEYAELQKGKRNQLLEHLHEKLGRSKEELELAIKKL